MKQKAEQQKLEEQKKKEEEDKRRAEEEKKLSDQQFHSDLEQESKLKQLNDTFAFNPPTNIKPNLEEFSMDEPVEFRSMEVDFTPQQSQPLMQGHFNQEFNQGYNDH